MYACQQQSSYCVTGVLLILFQNTLTLISCNCKLEFPVLVLIVLRSLTTESLFLALAAYARLWPWIPPRSSHYLLILSDTVVFKYVTVLFLFLSFFLSFTQYFKNSTGFHPYILKCLDYSLSVCRYSSYFACSCGKTMPFRMVGTGVLYVLYLSSQYSLL